MSVAAPTRKVAGRELPAPGKWTIDPAHTDTEFVARHLMVTRVRGGFEQVAGTIDIAERPEDSAVVVTIDAASIFTGTKDRDAHLRSPDFLDVDTYPEITFRSTAVAAADDGWRLTGDLTIKDVTRPLTLDLEFLGVSLDPWGNPKAAFTASGEIDREDYGLTWNVALEGGGVLVSRKVKIEIQAQAAPVS